MQEGAKCLNEAFVPVPDGQASGPPLDGLHWEKIAWSPSGTEWSSHSHPEAGSYKRVLLCPAQDQWEEEMWIYIKATTQKLWMRFLLNKLKDNCSSIAKMMRLNLHLFKSCSVILYHIGRICLPDVFAFKPVVSCVGAINHIGRQTCDGRRSIDLGFVPRRACCSFKSRSIPPPNPNLSTQPLIRGLL